MIAVLLIFYEICLIVRKKRKIPFLVDTTSVTSISKEL